MYAHTSLVTSVRAAVFLPQTAASASLSFFTAKRPTPFCFCKAAIFLPCAFDAVLPNARFSAVRFLSVAFVIVVFVAFTVVVVAVFVVVVIAIKG